jgi:hypothetical protein
MLQFNPSFDEDIIEKALAEPERYGAEYLSKWRDDLSTWLSRDLLDAAVDRGVSVRAPASNINYIAGCDASGGRNDSFTAAISPIGNMTVKYSSTFFTNGVLHSIRARLWLRLLRSCGNIAVHQDCWRQVRRVMDRRGVCEGRGAIRAV